LSAPAVRALHDQYGAAQLSLADRGYVAGVHPLELWLVTPYETRLAHQPPQAERVLPAEVADIGQVQVHERAARAAIEVHGACAVAAAGARRVRARQQVGCGVLSRRLRLWVTLEARVGARLSLTLQPVAACLMLMEEATMRDTVRKVHYFSITVPNRPGQAFRVLATLVSAGINLLGCSGYPRGRRAQIDVVPDDTRKFNAAVKKAELAFSDKKAGFLIQGEDRPGALADNLRQLAEHGVNVTAVDALAAGEGRWGAILWVKPTDVSRAGRLLRASAK
jgi:hypothetical protein